jgi:hypothetical protein
MRIVDAVRTQSEDRQTLIHDYLPLLLNYIAGLLYDRRVFARFKYTFERQWRLAFPDIPPPDYEGVFSYDTLMEKFYSHLLSNEESRLRVYKTLGMSGRIVSSAMVDSAVRSALSEMLFNTVVDILKFTGDIGQYGVGRAESLIAARLFKASPPPLTSVAVAVDLAGAGLDRSIPLLDRFLLVATAVRLASVVDVERLGAKLRVGVDGRRLEETGLCELIRSYLERDPCADRRNPLRSLAEIVTEADRGEIPATEELVATIAEAVIVMLAPFLDWLIRKTGAELSEDTA